MQVKFLFRQLCTSLFHEKSVLVCLEGDGPGLSRSTRDSVRSISFIFKKLIIDYITYIHIQQIFPEYILCNKHSPRFWGYAGESRQ